MGEAAGGPVSVIPRAPIWLSTGLSVTTLPGELNDRHVLKRTTS